MRYCLAPMEGITDAIYRRLHHRYFSGLDRYYMPFLSPTVHRSLTNREARELPFAREEAFTAIPQVLTKVPEDFLWAAQVIRDRGYGEVNLNLGCPSGTVTAKGKGSGMLRQPEQLEAFLDTVFSKTPLPISVKTRLGYEDPEEFPRLLEIFNRYPIAELTVHPRLRSQFYSGSADRQAFAYAYANSKNPLCYNGDIQSLAEARQIREDFPRLTGIMVGRGLIADPGMLTGGTKRETLQIFCDALLESYMAAFGGSRNAMFRLKENWSFLITAFDGGEKLWKRLRKTTDIDEYRAITAEIFASLPMKSPCGN